MEIFLTVALLLVLWELSNWLLGLLSCLFKPNKTNSANKKTGSQSEQKVTQPTPTVAKPTPPVQPIPRPRLDIYIKTKQGEEFLAAKENYANDIFTVYLPDRTGNPKRATTTYGVFETYMYLVKKGYEPFSKEKGELVDRLNASKPTWRSEKDSYLESIRPQTDDEKLENYFSEMCSNEEIGKRYERYVGYLYEKQGCNVYYNGIRKKFFDNGIDIIAKERARKNKRTFIIQCKYWSSEKKIHANTVHQLYGAAISYKRTHEEEVIIPIIFSKTNLSEAARNEAQVLGINVRDNFSLKQYPLVKCNVSSTKEKIYHLPWDASYDMNKIGTKTDERYVETVAEAENMGFRRALK